MLTRYGGKPASIIRLQISRSQCAVCFDLIRISGTELHCNQSPVRPQTTKTIDSIRTLSVNRK